MRRGALLALGALLLAVVSPAVSGHPAVEQTAGELQTRFDAEGNAEHKAKLLKKLGNALFAESRRAAKARDYATSVMLLEKYRNNVRIAIGELQRQYPNAEKQSSGYRVLEMHVREGIRETTDAMDSLPPEYRPPLQLVRDDLQAFHDQLLLLLFPRRPGERKKQRAAPAKGGKS